MSHELIRRIGRVGAGAVALGAVGLSSNAQADIDTPIPTNVGQPSPDFKPKPYKMVFPSISNSGTVGLTRERLAQREDYQTKFVKLLNMGVPGNAAQEILSINEKCDGCIYVGYKEDGIVEIAATAGPEFKPSIQKLSDSLNGSAKVTFYTDRFTKQKWIVANWELLPPNQ